VAGTYWLLLAPLTRLTFWGVCAIEVHSVKLGSFLRKPKVAGTYWGTYWLPLASLTRLTFWDVCAIEVHFGNAGQLPKKAESGWHLLAPVGFANPTDILGCLRNRGAFWKAGQLPKKAESGWHLLAPVGFANPADILGCLRNQDTFCKAGQLLKENRKWLAPFGSRWLR
jgi:hypothetical protein